MERRFALLQMDSVEGQRERNRAAVADAAGAARRAGADLLALPELWSSGYDLAAAVSDEDAARRGEEDVSLLSELARREGIVLFGGSLLLAAPGGGLANTAIVVERGAERLRYRKTHLFAPLGETRYLTAGEELPSPFSIAGISAAAAICYDLRFPELFRPLALAGVELIVVAAQWPRERLHHWRALLTARAIESQCFVAGVNRLGSFRATEFGGGSLVVAPDGEVLLDAGDAPGLHTCAFDPGACARYRARHPFLADRRDDLYP